MRVDTDSPVVASQKGKYVSKALNALAKGGSPPAPFQFNSQGTLAYVGNMYVCRLTACFERLTILRDCYSRPQSGKFWAEEVGHRRLRLAFLALRVFHAHCQHEKQVRLYEAASSTHLLIIDRHRFLIMAYWCV